MKRFREEATQGSYFLISRLDLDSSVRQLYLDKNQGVRAAQGWKHLRRKDSLSMKVRDGPAGMDGHLLCSCREVLGCKGKACTCLPVYPFIFDSACEATLFWKFLEATGAVQMAYNPFLSSSVPVCPRTS